MFKRLLVLSLVLVCCYCAENELLTEETRAKKSKKKLFRLITMALIFLLSKMAIFKAVTFFFFFVLFQKLFTLGGVLLTYMMKNQVAGPMAQPLTMYGPPEYNTLGYSYGPPDHEPVQNEGPSIPDLAGAFNWLSGKP